MRWNPFAHLRETKKYPSGRLLRSDKWRRIDDTFRVFYGDFFNTDENELGLLDYVFPLPRISQNLLYAGWKNTATFILAAIPTVPLVIVKLVVAAALTLVSSPFVFLAHLFVKPTSNKLSNQIQHLKVTVNKLEENKDSAVTKNKEKGQEKELGQAFNTEQMRSLLVMPVRRFDSESDYTSATKHQHNGLALGLFKGTWKLGENPISHGQKPEAIIEVIPENQNGIKALLKTNMFKATAYLEEEGLLDVLEETLQFKRA